MNALQNIFDISNSPILFLLYILYSLCLKGLALWKSARNSHKYWFIGLLIINLFGIPELLYIFYFSKNPINFSFLKNVKNKDKK
jgi:hypothetical protein